MILINLFVNIHSNCRKLTRDIYQYGKVKHKIV